jgi:hypothetical protein
LVGPLEGLGHRLVVVLDELDHFGLQVFNGCERTALEKLPNQNAELNLDLIQPRAVLRCVVKDNTMRRYHLNKPGGEFQKDTASCEVAISAMAG